MVLVCTATGRRRRLRLEQAKQSVGASVDVQVSRVAAIAPEKSGKYRYIVSHAFEAS